MKNKLYIFIVFILTCFTTACNRKNIEYVSLLNVPDYKKNWIPLFLSQSETIMNQVYNYYENHDLDTNETWGYFSIDKNLTFFEEANLINNAILLNKQKLEKK